MAIPNLIAVLLLSPVIVKETKKYINNLDAVDDTSIPVVKTGIGNDKSNFLWFRFRSGGKQDDSDH